MAYSRHDSRAEAGRAGAKENEESLQSSLKPLKAFAVVLAIVTVLATIINFNSLIHFKVSALPEFFAQPLSIFQWHRGEPEEPDEETPKVIYIQARPSAEPTPTPAITSFKLLTYGRELGPDGFTTYVDDRPVVLSVEMVPYMSHPPVDWSVSDDTAASLSVSSDNKQCEFSALRDAGKIELTVSCNEAKIVIPVYLWEKPAG